MSDKYIIANKNLINYVKLYNETTNIVNNNIIEFRYLKSLRKAVLLDKENDK